MLQSGMYLETDSAAGACLYQHGPRCRVSAVVFDWTLVRTELGACATAWYASRDSLGSWRLPVLQPGTYLMTVSAVGACLYKHGRRLSGISSIFWLGAGSYGVGRQCYSLVCMSRQSRQLALAFINTGAGCRVSLAIFGWALVRTESGANGTAWYVCRDSLGSWRLPL